MPVKVEEGWKGLTPDLKLHALIYSEPGGGKTTLAATLKGRKLWLDFDDGMKSLDYDPSIIRVPTSQLQRHSDILECLTDTWRKYNCQVIVMDTVTTLYRIEVEDYLRLSSKHPIPTLAEYGPAAERTRQLMNYALKIEEVHTILCAHRFAEKDEVFGRVMGGPNVPGKLVYDAPGMVDEMYYLTKVPDAKLQKDVVKVCTVGDGIWPAKTRLGKDGIFEKYERPDLEYLISKAITTRCKPESQVGGPAAG